MIFEYYVPAAKRGQGVIEIDRIDYGYRNTLSKPSQDKKGKLFVFSAPSGSGKTTIVRHLLNQKRFDLENAA